MHDFIFSRGIWLGEGSIAFSASPELIKFYMKWDVLSETNGLIQATQTIQMQGIEENTLNHFTFLNISTNSFDIILENQFFEKFSGLGELTDKTISWKFQEKGVFEGFENYKKLENGEFFLQAEYGVDEYRTLIEGILWQKSL